MFFFPVSNPPIALVFTIAGNVALWFICEFFTNKWRQRNPTSYIICYQGIMLGHEVREMLNAQKSPRIWFRKKPKGAVLQNDCLPEDIIGDSNLKPIDIGQLVMLVDNHQIKGMERFSSEWDRYILLMSKDKHPYLINYSCWYEEYPTPPILEVCQSDCKIRAGSILITA